MNTYRKKLIKSPEVEARIINKICNAPQYSIGQYAYFVWPYKGILPIEPSELHYLIEQLSLLVPADTECLLTFMSDGDILGVPLAMYMNLPIVVCRDCEYRMADPVRIKQKTGYFERPLFFGHPKEGTRFCIIDAIISTGNTACAAIQAIRHSKCSVNSVIAVLEKTKMEGIAEINRVTGIQAKVLYHLRQGSGDKLDVTRSKE